MPAAPYAAAAEALAGRPLPLGEATAVVGLLEKLGWSDAASPRRDDRIALLRLAAGCRRVFRLASPLAPGAVLLGAELVPADFGLAGWDRPFSLAGRGESLGEAFGGCLGEAAEVLGFLEWGDERRWPAAPALARQLLPAERAWLAAQLDLQGEGALADEPWLPAERLPGGEAVALPLRLCLRQPGAAFAASSAGVAAGPGREQALAAALLELLERDAVALWWYGERPARAVAAATLEDWGLAALERRLRAGAAAPRRTWFLELTDEFGPAVLAAFSDDGAGGPPAMGFAAAPEPAAAARAALLELCQMELSQLLIGLKLRQAGAEALSPADRQALARQTRAAALAAEAPLPPSPGAVAGAPPPLRRLAAAGLQAYALELTRPGLGIAVVRVLVPGLELLPLRRPGPRLAAALAGQGRRADTLADLASPI